MATYVNNLRLKEIATGAESGTWGTSTNTNLELIGDGLGYGTEQVAADSNETFTMADGVADGMRAMYLKFTSAGSLTATRTLTLAPNTVSKVWIIENATTGSQIITIKQGSGATVNIPNGERAMVYTDGAGAGGAVFTANPSVAAGDATQTLSDGATVNWDISAGNIGLWAIGGNRILAAPTNLVVGSSALRITQDGTGSRTVTWNSIFKWSGGAAPVLSTAGGAIDIVSFIYDGTNLYGSLVSRGAA